MKVSFICKVYCVFIVFLSKLILLWITYNQYWTTLFDSLCYIHYLTHGTNIREFKLISNLLIISEPYSSIIPYIIHLIIAITYRDLLLCNFIDIITGDILGVKLKSFVVWIIEPRVPDRFFRLIASIYWKYYYFLIKYRPDI